MSALQKSHCVYEYEEIPEFTRDRKVSGGSAQAGSGGATSAPVRKLKGKQGAAKRTQNQSQRTTLQYANEKFASQRRVKQPLAGSQQLVSTPMKGRRGKLDRVASPAAAYQQQVNFCDEEAIDEEDLGEGLVGAARRARGPQHHQQQAASNQSSCQKSPSTVAASHGRHAKAKKQLYEVLLLQHSKKTAQTKYEKLTLSSMTKQRQS